MNLRVVALLFVALAATCTGTGTPSGGIFFQQEGRAGGSEPFTFTVGLPPKDFDGLEAYLAAASNVSHARYGQWLSRGEVWGFMEPTKATREAAHQWATSTGAHCSPQMSAWRCRGTVAQVEALLNTELSVFKHSVTGKRVIRASAPASVPAHLQGTVNLVTGVVHLPTPRLGTLHRVAPPAGDFSIVPSTMRTLYSVPPAQAGGSAGVTQAALELLGYPAPESTDIAGFFNTTASVPYTLLPAHIIGKYEEATFAFESTLDREYIAALGAQTTNFYWSEADWLFELGQSLASQDPLPSVLSISYAWSELSQCEVAPGAAPCNASTGNATAGSVAYVTAVNQLLAAATVRGVTIAVAAGDSGAHGRSDPYCSLRTTTADFPASSPYVTTVGATLLAGGRTGPAPEPICATVLACAIGGQEVVATRQFGAPFSSGGGFSAIAGRSAWQADAVDAYLAGNSSSGALPPASAFTPTGRAFPDVSALGHPFYLNMMGSVFHVSGSSAATPVFAGMVSLLNAWRAQHSAPALGFVTPLLYKAYALDPLAFNDVTQGDNSCTEETCPCPAGTGFAATPGWDAASGLGTVNFPRLQAAIATLTGMHIQ